MIPFVPDRVSVRGAETRTLVRQVQSRNSRRVKGIREERKKDRKKEKCIELYTGTKLEKQRTQIFDSVVAEPSSSRSRAATGKRYHPPQLRLSVVTMAGPTATRIVFSFSLITFPFSSFLYPFQFYFYFICYSTESATFFRFRVILRSALAMASFAFVASGGKTRIYSRNKKKTAAGRRRIPISVIIQ